MPKRPISFRQAALWSVLAAVLLFSPTVVMGEGILEGSVIDVYRDGYFSDVSSSDWNKVVSGMYLVPGHRLKTSEKGTLTLFMDTKHLVRLDPDTEIRIADFTGIGGVEVIREYDKSRIIIELVRGNISCSVAARPGDHGFAVFSGMAVAVPADDGAEFSLTITETGSDTGEVTLVVREGSVVFMTVDGAGGSVGDPVTVGPEMSSVVTFTPRGETGTEPSDE